MRAHCSLRRPAGRSGGIVRRLRTSSPVLYQGRTDPAITKADLRLRLSDFEPDGEGGTWFQDVPMLRVGPDAAATVRIGDDA